jgi:branched-chain amino acid transport system substrate-binding protein
VRALPSSRCGRVFAGAGPTGPRLLIVSDLPLQGGARIPTQQMAQAIAFVLRRHAFRAGRFEVAYQSCDDSIARTGLFDHARCAGNARAFAENEDVVGVIGPFNSGCAVDAIPVLSTATGGPVGMVSSSASYVGLTRTGPGVPTGGLTALYPTGLRNFVRVSPTDDLADAALAQLLRSLGRSSVYVLHDGEPGYGAQHALGFDRAARRAGLRLVGTTRWDPRATSYSTLAGRVAESGAEAVFLGGLIDTNVTAVIHDLRARLGPKVVLVGPDGLTPISLLLERGGKAARGTYVALAGLTDESFGPVAKRFVRDFGATQPGARVQPVAVYAAQAAEVLLDAIARSDGTRGSVARELFSTRLRGSLLGDVSFDRNGDMLGSPITIVRAARGGGATTILSVEGAELDRVVRPPLDLVR